MANALTLLQSVLAVLQACAPAISLVLIGLWGQRQAAAGAQTQAAQDVASTDAAAVKAETAIAAAEAAAPTTRLAVIDRLKAGTV